MKPYPGEPSKLAYNTYAEQFEKLACGQSAD